MRNSKVLFTAVKGAAMGIAEVIPGVSGGTIAFITGIYEELIFSIRQCNLQQLRLVFQGRWKEAWANINGNFLFQLGVGMAMGILFGILVVTHLVENYPEILWGFFFGLILASAFYILSLMEKITLFQIFLIGIAAVFAYGVTELTPAEGSTHLAFVFLSGVVAVSALLLPGLSGSFVLLVLGMYTIILPAAKSVLTEGDLSALLLIGTFAVGCVVGLALFSRVLTYLFKNFKLTTFALLSGFMLGSLNKIWPWREGRLWMGPEGQIYSEQPLNIDAEMRILREAKVWPGDYSDNPYLLFTILAFLLGLIVIFALWKNQKPVTSS